MSLASSSSSSLSSSVARGTTRREQHAYDCCCQHSSDACRNVRLHALARIDPVALHHTRKCQNTTRTFTKSPTLFETNYGHFDYGHQRMAIVITAFLPYIISVDL